MRLANDRMELVTLLGGGAIADLRLNLGFPAQRRNLLWETPWPSLDPHRYRARVHNRTYGPAFVGRFLAGFTGHSLCLDYFGAPSEAEVGEGLCLHGEAAVARWGVLRQAESKTSVSLLMEARLPNAGLRFQRKFHMRQGEAVVYVSEAIFNLHATDHFFHWTQHVTLGPPFLQAEASMICLPATRGVTWSHGYEGKSLLADAQEFAWPYAPATDGSRVDLSRCFIRRGTGFVAAALLDPERDLGFVSALNFRLGLLLGYCFPRRVFPWVAIWEENCARNDSPWKGRTQARGLEFGTTPMPVGKREAFAVGSLWGVPTFCCVPARGKLEAGYAIFLAPVNPDWREILDIQAAKDAIIVEGSNHESMEVPARGLRAIALV